MPQFSRVQLIFAAAAFFIILLVLLFTGVIPGFVREKFESIELNMVGFEDRRTFSPLIDSFREKFPHIKINYQEVDINSYENVLINQLAAGRGPDIFMFHNSWLPKHFDKITPVSEEQLPYSQFQSLFPTVVVQDFAPSGPIFALPLYIDNLALYYNKSALDAAGIAIPPRNWLEFQNAVLKLRQTDPAGRLLKPAAALGGSPRNLHRATDILNFFFLQSGVSMVDNNFTRATFAADGLAAFNFYLSFSDPNQSFYTWNSFQPNSLDLFASGQLPLMFHYRYQTPLLRLANPSLEFGIAPIPQPTAPGPKVTYADYYGLAVSSASFHSKEAWDFILHATADSAANQLYLQATGLPPALRSLINLYANDPELGVFANQALTARSWPQIDNQAVERIFGQMIESSLTGGLESHQAIRQAENEITSLMQRRF